MVAYLKITNELLRAGSNTKSFIKGFRRSYCEDINTSAILEYVIALCQVSRNISFSANALSPRAGKALLNAAKAWAFLANRDYVLPEDVQAVFSAVCLHRLETASEDFNQPGDTLADEILQQVDVLNPLS